MNIISTILTKTAEETTANANYTIEYITINGVLSRIHVAIRNLPIEETQNEILGYITLENGNIFCNLVTTASLSLIFADFEHFMKKITESITTDNSVTE